MTQDDDATRVKFCTICGAEIQWRATRCKACGKAQPRLQQDPPAPPSPPRQQTGALPTQPPPAAGNVSSPASRAAARMEQQRREWAESAPARAAAAANPKVAPSVVAASLLAVVGFLGAAIAWSNRMSTRWELHRGEVPYLNWDNINAAAALFLVGAIAAAWLVIRSAVLSALRAHDTDA